MRTKGIPALLEFLRKNLFLIAFSLWFAFQILFESTFIYANEEAWNAVRTVIYQAVKLCLAVQIVFFQRYSLRELAVYGIVTLIALVARRYAQTSWIWLAWFFALAAKEQKPERIFRCAFVCELLGLLILAVVSLSGCIPMIRMERGLIGAEVRYALGMKHPNSLGLAVFGLCCSGLYLWQKHIRAVAAGLLAAAVFTWMVPNSRTSVAVICFMLAVFLAGRWILRRFGQRGLVWLAIGSVIAGVLANGVILLLCRFYPQIPNAQLLNHLFTGRLEYGYAYTQTYPVTLFGTPVDAEVVGMTLDCGHLNMLLQHGLLQYICFSLLPLHGMYRAIRKGDTALGAIILSCIVFATMETINQMLRFNLSLLFLAYAIGGKPCFPPRFSQITDFIKNKRLCS